MSRNELERRHIFHNGELIIYYIRRSKRARKISISIDMNGRVVLIMPPLMPELIGSRFVKKNADWALKGIKSMEKYEDCISLPHSRKDYLKHKERARALAEKHLLKYNEYYGFDYNRVSIKNLRRNWGSCSAKKNLNFNYKICHIPEHHAEYIIVHELCHLQEFNHSKKFWALVAKTIPDHKVRRKELQKYLL